MMDLIHRHNDSVLIALFAERMRFHVTISNTFPGSAVPSAYSRITVVLLVAGILLLLMLLTVTAVGQFRTPWVGTRLLRFSRHMHHLHLMDIKKASQELGDSRKAVLYSAFCMITIS